MPKQKYSLIQRLKMSYWFITGKKGYGLIESCGICGGTRFRRVKARDNKLIYRVHYKCLDCGAVARAKEKWRGKACY